MGTLTGDLPQLADHCPHKLPTSCRLTSTTLCCACYDKRQHTTSYRKYIDGVGFVYRGTRWQDYCWFCKEFWDNRTAAAGLQPQDTQIPGNPDQTGFVERWFDFHRGYRIECDRDGEERKIELRLAEPWRDVEPGFLPRSEEEVAQGISRSRFDPVHSTVRASAAAEEPVQSIDAALDELLLETEDEPAVQNDGSRRRSQDTPEHAQESVPIPDVSQTQLQSLAQQRDAQRRRAERAERQRAAFARLFGTREEVEAQGENYQSPITGMYQRAWERYRVAEQARRERPAAGVPLYHFNDGTTVPLFEDIPPLHPALRRQPTPQPARGLDIDDGRPEALPRESMVKNMECKVCYQQLASEAMLPCGHLAMCQWCANQTVPFRHANASDGSVIRGVQCPSCRRTVNRRVKVYFG